MLPRALSFSLTLQGLPLQTGSQLVHADAVDRGVLVFRGYDLGDVPEYLAHKVETLHRARVALKDNRIARKLIARHLEQPLNILDFFRQVDRKSTRLNSSHYRASRMPVS